MPEPELPSKNRVSAIILAAGTGVRLGGRGKAFLTINGQSYLERAVKMMAEISDDVLVCLHKSEIDLLAEEYRALSCRFIEGGNTRQESFENAFSHVATDITLVHDVARPLCNVELVKRVLGCIEGEDAVAPCVKIKTRDSLSYIEGGVIKGALDRENVVSLQTPQAYQTKKLKEVLALAIQKGWLETSIVTLFTKAGFPVAAIDGHPNNIKVTYEEDEAFVDALLRQAVEGSI